MTPLKLILQNSKCTMRGYYIVNFNIQSIFFFADRNVTQTDKSVL